jgi:hypothetical protein
MKNISSYILKISGSIELPKEIELGKDYDVLISGSVVKKEDIDNHNGTIDVRYTLKPVLGEVKNDRGETFKLKDTRSNSELNRAQARAIFIERQLGIDFDTFYDAYCKEQRHQADVLADKVIKFNQW